MHKCNCRQCTNVVDVEQITEETLLNALNTQPKIRGSENGRSVVILRRLLQRYHGNVRNPSVAEIRQIKEACIDEGLRQEQIAAELGVSQPTLSRWLKKLKATENPDEN
jgi:DNA invertase Pin-like site-specific DNA recombinase